MGSNTPRLSNYVAYIDGETGLHRIGHFYLEKDIIQPLSFISGTPIENLYQVVEAGVQNVTATGPEVPANSVQLLPPISGRDVLAVGKNYMEHAKEFNSSGYDSSDKVDLPSHPVIFTKRATSIVANGAEILPHHDFTQTPDYEGEIGVIIGKSGYRIKEQDAWDHVWGYTIINDVTARERQRDHKQFYIGKSPDTYCPMGPIAVPKEDLPKELRVQTFVNGQERQNATTDDLIFSIPVLVRTLSEGQTLQPGDVIASGTPAGVGFGQKPPTFLQPGDEVAISVTGLGTLHNKIASTSQTNSTVARVQSQSAFQPTNAAKSINGHIGLTTINSKLLHYKQLGPGATSIVFCHGLGGTMDYYTPLHSALSLQESYSLHLFDLEGHGSSPTHPLHALSIGSFAADTGGVLQHAGVTESNAGILVAHSMGCLAAMTFAIDNPKLVKKLILIGPPPSPLPEAASQGTHARATLARTKGMAAVVDAVVTNGTSDHTKTTNPLAVAAARLSLLGQDPEGYAKACSALAGATNELKVEGIEAETLLITGDADKVSPPAICEKYASRIKNSRVKVLEGCGHWHNFENLPGVAEAVKSFI